MKFFSWGPPSWKDWMDYTKKGSLGPGASDALHLIHILHRQSNIVSQIIVLIFIHVLIEILVNEYLNRDEIQIGKFYFHASHCKD